MGVRITSYYFLLSEDKRLARTILKLLEWWEEGRERPEAIIINDAILKLSFILEDCWNEIVLSQFTEKEREVIIKYKKGLWEVLLILGKKSLGEYNFGSPEALEGSAEEKLRRRYPGVRIPKNIVKLEAKRIFTKLEKFFMKIAQPWCLEEVEERLSIMKAQGVLRTPEELTEKERQKLEELRKFLKNPANRKLWKRYTEKLFNPPRAVFVIPLWKYEEYAELMETLWKTLKLGTKEEISGLLDYIRGAKNEKNS